MKQNQQTTAIDTIQQVIPQAMVPSSWGYGTFHQNNPLYINMVKASGPTPTQSSSTVSSKLIDNDEVALTTPATLDSQVNKSCNRRLLQGTQIIKNNARVCAQQQGHDCRSFKI